LPLPPPGTAAGSRGSGPPSCMLSASSCHSGISVNTRSPNFAVSGGPPAQHRPPLRGGAAHCTPSSSHSNSGLVAMNMNHLRPPPSTQPPVPWKRPWAGGPPLTAKLGLLVFTDMGYARVTGGCA
jgi:hypothetical protein